MRDYTEFFVQYSAFTVLILGILAVVSGPLIVAWRLFLNHGRIDFSSFKDDIGKSSLLGLDFFIAGDIIETVVIETTFQNILILGCIVLLRAILAGSIKVEQEV